MVGVGICTRGGRGCYGGPLAMKAMEDRTIDLGAGTTYAYYAWAIGGKVGCQRATRRGGACFGRDGTDVGGVGNFDRYTGL